MLIILVCFYKLVQSITTIFYCYVFAESMFLSMEIQPFRMRPSFLVDFLPSLRTSLLRLL